MTASPQRYAVLMERFDELCDLDEAGRAPLLEKLRADDPELWAELVRLLRHDRDSTTAARRDGPQLDAFSLFDAAEDDDGARPKHIAPLSPPSTLVAERYEIRRPLGSGGAGAVFSAFDRETQREVALKFLRSQPDEDPRDVCRFRREFRAVSRLSHPGCLQVFAEGTEAGRRYIVMEYAAGGDLSRLCGADPALLLYLLAQLAGALDYVHGCGIVHRDLKPQNVLLTAEETPQPKLSDFGLAKVFDEDPNSLSESSGLVGTVDYMAPEQVQGLPVDPRTDLYAFGCLIYKLWSGRPPFLGSPFERLSARLRGGAPPLRSIVRDVSAELDALVERLLRTDPRERPQSALEVGRVLARLLAARSGDLASQPLWLRSHSSRSVLYQPGFIGRGALIERITHAAQAAFSGREPSREAPSLLVVRGEAGLGKSALLRVVRRRLEALGATVLCARVPSEGASPLAPFAELAARVTGRSSDEPPIAGTRGRQPLEGVAALHGEAMALAEPLRALLRVRPLAVLLEDLHDATDSARLLLRELSRVLTSTGRGAARPLFVCTLRPARLTTLLEEDAAFGSITITDLAPLDAPELAEFAASMLGTVAGELPARLLERLAEGSQGNPLLAQAMLRTLADSGSLRRDEAGWVFAPPAPADSVLPLRLDALSPSARHILEWAAIAGQRFDVALLAAASGIVEDELLDGLDEALRRNIVRPLAAVRRDERTDGPGLLDTYEFEHARFVDVLRAGLLGTRRAACHAAMAEALRERPGSSAALLSHHYTEGGRQAEAARYLVIAGQQALSAHDYAAAQRHFQDALAGISALDAAERDAARERAVEGLAEAQVALGQAQPAATALQALLKEPAGSSRPTRLAREARSVRARRLRKLGMARLHLGDIAGAMAALEQALDVLGDRLPLRRAALFLRLAFDACLALLSLLLGPRTDRGPVDHGRVDRGRAPRRGGEQLESEERVLLHRELALLYRWVDGERAAAHHFAFARAASRLLSPAYLVDACAAVAVFLAIGGSTALGSWVERRTRALASSTDDRHGLARLNLLRGGADVLLRADARGLDTLRQGTREAQGLADPLLFAWALDFLAWTEILASRFDDAARDLERASEIAERLQIAWLRADTSCAQALIESIQGRFDQAAERARGLLAEDLRLSLPAIEAVATEVLGGIAFMTGRYRDASALFERAHLLYVSHHLEHGWGFLMQIERSEALLMQADEEGAAAVPDLAARLAEHARLTERRYGRLPHYRGCALVLFGVHAARTGRAARARQQFAEALRLRPPPRTTHIDGWVLWRVAFELHRLGEPAFAVEPLLQEVEAINSATGMHGMSQFLARARALYRL
ncbi:MAG: protein kinase [Polyangia bacterium]